jgi:pimeloyl-ACP methyl ester carboxylesterase
MNPPGFGQSSGPVSVGNYPSGALSAYDFLTERYSVAPMWIYGKSIRATAAIYVAAHHAPTGLVVKNVIDVPTVTRQRAGRCCQHA